MVLLAGLTEAGSTLHTTTITPQQIAIFVRFWGMPTLVAELIKKLYPSIKRMIIKSNYSNDYAKFRKYNLRKNKITTISFHLIYA